MAEILSRKDAFRQSKRVLSALINFIEACPEWLEIVDLPTWRFSRYWLRCLARFEGVPEVYPIAEALLDAVGPGARYDIDWFPPGWAPELRSALADVAFRVRALILVDWEWPRGFAVAEIRRRVDERMRTGCLAPLVKVHRAMLESIERAVPPEDHYKCFKTPGPFREDVPSEKREQFDRVVRMIIGRAGPSPFLAPRDDLDVRAINEEIEASAWGQSYRFLSSVDLARDRAYPHIDDLDGFERRLLEDQPRSKTLEVLAIADQLDSHQNKPIVGVRAATLSYVVYRGLINAACHLSDAVDSLRRPGDETAPIEPVEAPPRPTDPPSTPEAMPFPSPVSNAVHTIEIIDDFVTLDQAAGMVHRSKRSLERHVTAGNLPTPAVEGGGGRPHLYRWPEMRVSLQTIFGMTLPDRFPGSRLG